jgi:hypothetical protein
MKIKSNFPLEVQIFCHSDIKTGEAAVKYVLLNFAYFNVFAYFFIGEVQNFPVSWPPLANF